jgi:alanyl-tRNA synthetase
LRNVLGTHVAQKGSLVNEHVTRFDFSHFSKVTDEELEAIEKLVNKKIRENIPLDERKNVPINTAMEMGAMALFGEKYGDEVRVITFDPSYSVELCGGTHVNATGEIGMLKILSESSVAAGVRRVEAVTGEGAEEYISEKEKQTDQIKRLLKNAKDPVVAITQLLAEQEELKNKLEHFSNENAKALRDELKEKVQVINGFNVIAEQIKIDNADSVKSISYDLRKSIPNLILLIAANIQEKPHLSLIISDELQKDKKLDASKMIRELAREIKGGGGGQPYYATAGGKEINGLSNAIQKGIELFNTID